MGSSGAPRKISLPLTAALLASVVAGCAGGLGGGGTNPSGQAGTERQQRETRRAELLKPGPLGEKALGRPDAPVTMIEYASLTCPICRGFHGGVFPKFKKAYIDTGKVYFIYREFPIGRSAAAAALAVRCSPEKDYFRLQEKFLATQPQWVAEDVKHDAIFNVVKDTGLTRAAFDTCLANQNINNGLIWVKQRGREFGVSGTPYFFINGEPRRGAVTFDDLKAIIDPLLAQSPGRQA